MGNGDGGGDFNISIGESVHNCNLKEVAMAAGGWDGISPATLRFTVEEGVEIGSASAERAALETGDLGSAEVLLTNNGSITGKGGGGRRRRWGEQRYSPARSRRRNSDFGLFSHRDCQ